MPIRTLVMLAAFVGGGHGPAAPVAAHAAGTGQSVPRPRVDPQSGRPIATIRDIRRTVLPDAVRVTIELDAEVPFHDERIGDPQRVFVDLSGARPTPGLADNTIRFENDADIVHQIRIGRHPNNVTRVVLDADRMSSYAAYPLYAPFRIVIDCVRATTVTPVTPTRTAPPPAPPPVIIRDPILLPLRSRRLPTPATITPARGLAPKSARQIARAYATVPTDDVALEVPSDLAIEPPAKTGTPPAFSPPAIEAPGRNRSGGFSMSRQLGLGVSRIVIDPGHGGHDPGAKGKGISEAELVLDVALRLEKQLQKVSGVDVILTRRTDEFIALQERTAIANREGADLFLSIHANANSNAQVRGVETYFLNFANNLSAAAVAARENAASGQTMGALPDLVKTIALNNKLDESRDFATAIQRTMMDKLSLTNKTKDLGVKQAPFVVLIGAAMPSVLAEIAFVTNPQEARLLKGAAYRQKIADALFNAIRSYQTSLKSTKTAAQQ